MMLGLILRPNGCWLPMDNKLIPHLLAQTERAYAIQAELTAIPALGPGNGGQGEWLKAALVQKLLTGCGIKHIIRMDSPDSRVPSGLRPNIIASVPGLSSRKLWLFGHLDIVPPGEGWASDPFCVRREGDLIYGRGVEDNQQAITSMLLLAEALGTLDINPPLGLNLVFMSDEESGSSHGLARLLGQAPDLFSPDDLYIVPDGGSPDAVSVEVAEKAQLWLKVTVHGRQCHASMPQNGLNALVLASKMITRLAELDFPERDSLFEPSWSTFVPTRHDGNGEAINIMPGRDVFYMDCRLLPGLTPDQARQRILAICEEVCSATGGSVEISVVQEQKASSIDPHGPAVKALEAAIAAVYGVSAHPCGIGGATVAALLRHAGLPAIVWSCIRNTCHQPNECASLTAACRDAAVFAHMLMHGTADA